MKDIQTLHQVEDPKATSMRISGSEAIIRCLIAEGVDLLYGYPGGAIMPVYDELFKFRDQIHHVLSRHEQGAAMRHRGMPVFQEKLALP